MKIAILDAKTLGEIDFKIFEKFGEVRVYPTTSESEKLERVKDIDIIITNKVILDRELLESAKNLKLICISATGVNNVDLEEAKKRDISVKNVAGYSTNSVVQHTFAMLFYLIEQLKYYDEYVKSKKWQESPLFTHLDKEFFEISGKRWGVIGLGEIGKSVARVAKAFGSKVCYYSSSGKNSDSEFDRVELNELLENSDIISIHAPLNENTKSLLNYEKLSLLKEGAVLLNLGRGGIVDELALSKIIDEREIYVGLDVLEQEPIREYNPLNFIENRDRLFISPHIAWTSKEAREILIDKIVKNIDEFLKER